MRLPTVFFLLLLLFSCQGSSSFDACEDHFNLEELISEEIERAGAGSSGPIKIIQSGNDIDTVALNYPELHEYLQGLVEFNIDLPNLLGKYSCKTIYENGNERVGNYYIAEHNNLSVREFHTVISDEGIVASIGATKTVGSFLARVQKELEWDLLEGTIKLHIHYDNFIGSEKEYFITIEY